MKRAQVTLELETDKQVYISNFIDAEKEGITVLGAVYAICYMPESFSLADAVAVECVSVMVAIGLPFYFKNHIC